MNKLFTCTAIIFCCSLLIKMCKLLPFKIGIVVAIFLVIVALVAGGIVIFQIYKDKRDGKI